MRKVAKTLVAIAVVSALSAPAGADHRPRSDYEPGEVVRANSHFGNGSITGIVRPARFGWEVRLPHGTWVDCRRSCEETLRVQTVDLTEQQEGGGISGYGTAAQECGLFGCLRLGF